MTTNFLKELRVLCTERNVLLMLDEVQCGIGRTGNFFAFEKSGIQPDAIGMAKGLGGGLRTLSPKRLLFSVPIPGLGQGF